MMFLQGTNEHNTKRGEEKMKKDTWILKNKQGNTPWRKLRRGYGANKKLEKASRAIAQAQGLIWDLMSGTETELPDELHETDMYDVMIKELHIIDQEETRVRVSFQLFGSDWSIIEQSDAWKEIENMLREQQKLRICKQRLTLGGELASEYYES